MELEKKLHQLKAKNELDVIHIEEITNVDELFFRMIEVLGSSKPNYRMLYSIFDGIRELMFEQGDLNVFEEFLTIKYAFLEEVYNLDTIILDAILVLIGPVALDFELEERVFKEDEFFNFILQRYNHFKQNNELTVLKLLNSLDISQLQFEGKELQGVIEDLKKSANIK